MFLLAARALAASVPDERLARSALYPALDSIRDVSRAIATAVVEESVARGLSVRQVEELARRLREGGGAARGTIASRPADAEIERVEDDLRRALGTKVRLALSRRGGRIMIEWYSDEELGRLYERLTGGNG